MIAIQYARWSSMEQSKGSTLARQLEVTQAHIQAMAWELRGEPLIDKGRSAYTGDNLENGQLGKFAALIHSGAVDASTHVLVVEELDRLSRQPADVMLTWLSPLVRRGLSIKVVNTGQMISRAMLDHDMGGLMMILIGAFGSHTESRKKAERVSAAWAAKREAAREGKDVQRNHRRPKWVELAADGTFYVPEAKARIIRLIFENRIRGIGKGLTAKTLNELAQTDTLFAPWELDAGQRAAPTLWTATYVGRVLRNRAVLGEWQPYSRPRKGEVKAAGDAIEGYYPQLIDPATFARANDSRISDALKHQGRGRGLSNLLGTKAVCGTCGDKMEAKGSASHFTNKKGEKRRHYFLYCRAAKSGLGCTNARGWTYDRVEKPILDCILSLAMDDQHFGGSIDTAPLEAAVHNARASIVETERKIELVLDAIESGGGESAKARLGQRQRELEAATAALTLAQNELASARGKVSPSEHIRRVSEVRTLMFDEDENVRFEARSRVKAALGDILDSVTFYPHTGNASVLLVDRMRMFTVSHDGQVTDDLDFMSLFPGEAGPGYGAVKVVEDGVSRRENDLDHHQQAASRAYVQRLARSAEP